MGPLSICRCLSFHALTSESAAIHTHTSIIAPRIHLDDILDNGHLLRCTVQRCSNPNSLEKWGLFFEFAGRRLIFGRRDAAKWVLARSICLQNLTLQQAHAWSYDDYIVQDKDMIHLTFNLNSDLHWLIADKVLNRLASILLRFYWLCHHWPVTITVKHNVERQRAM